MAEGKLQISKCKMQRVEGGGEFQNAKCKYQIAEALARVPQAATPAKTGIQKCLINLDSGPRFACPE
jgi:hypothetical protein